MTPRSRDVIVIGAGPAGSTTASALAAQGVDVLVLERAHFPREHVGESLLPACSVVQEVLGIEPSPDVFVHKQGAQFVCEQTGRIAKFDFAEALAGPPRHAYHVDRALFDLRLRDRARNHGAEVRHGVAVGSVEIDPQGVRVKTNHGVEQARYVVDATGQDRLLGRQSRSILPFKHFGKAASFTQYEDVPESAFQELAPHNDIRVLMLDEGWAWIIPLPKARLSVGVVSRKQGMRDTDIFDLVSTSPILRRWTAGSHPCTPRLIGNFSFRNHTAFGSRFACVGDSVCFIDPVFSSGVSLAIRGALSLAERLVPALQSGAEADPQLAAPTHAWMEPGYDTFAALVYRFYNTRFVDNFLFGAPDDGDMRACVTSVLAGDVFRPGNQFRDMLRASRLKPWADHHRPTAATPTQEAT